MKRLVFGLGLMFATVLSATFGGSAIAQDATPEGGECVETTIEENVATARTALEADETLDGETIDAVMSETHIDNVELFGVEDDPTTNDDELARRVRQERLFPGSTLDINDIYGAGDKVVVEATFTIHEHVITGELVELDEALAIDSVTIFTFECGLIQTTYNVTDRATLFAELGLDGGFEVAAPEVPATPEG